MLQLNPNEVIRYSKLINDSLNIIDENLLYLKKKYSDTNKIEQLELFDLENLITKIKNSTLFLTKIINELVEATDEPLSKLLETKHSLNFFENKLLAHYANNINDNAPNSKLAVIDLCYNRDNKLSNYCKKKNFIYYIENHVQYFNPEIYGISSEKFISDLIDIYDKRGPNEAYAIIRALENNCPNNYHEYHFNPTNQMHSNEHYDFNNNTINNYQTNSEIININGYNYEIAQVLPRDANETELLAYNFGKANIINTMRTLPSKYLEICSKGNSNTITLTCNRSTMNNNANWSGYYKPSTFFGKNNNNITIDIHGSFNDNTFYTQDTLIHEMGHKFDDLIQSKNIISWILGKTSYTTSNEKWEDAYKKYGNVLTSINLGGYTKYPNVSEFFGDITVAYFKNPDELKSLCPEAYNLMNNMLDGEYGYSYSEKIVAILNATG